jgi:hypothetical protein
VSGLSFCWITGAVSGKREGHLVNKKVFWDSIHEKELLRTGSLKKFGYAFGLSLPIKGGLWYNF